MRSGRECLLCEKVSKNVQNLYIFANIHPLRINGN